MNPTILVAASRSDDFWLLRQGGLSTLIVASRGPEEMAKGVMKLLEDRINGSTLLVSKSLGSRYIGFQEEFKNIPLE
ncbi:hypothetical protein TNCV_3330801 [Trichonephila clavipes]|nr:hypothetical protein TNCV_3330801 [Trichonephila clavipes]